MANSCLNRGPSGQQCIGGVRHHGPCANIDGAWENPNPIGDPKSGKLRGRAFIPGEELKRNWFGAPTAATAMLNEGSKAIRNSDILGRTARMDVAGGERLAQATKAQALPWVPSVDDWDLLPDA